MLRAKGAGFFRSDVLSEVELMLRIGIATHIVGLIGYTCLNEAPVLVSEYCAKGDLLRVIRDSLADYKDCVRAVTGSGSRHESVVISDNRRVASKALLKY